MAGAAFPVVPSLYRKGLLQRISSSKERQRRKVGKRGKGSESKEGEREERREEGNKRWAGESCVAASRAAWDSGFPHGVPGIRSSWLCQAAHGSPKCLDSCRGPILLAMAWSSPEPDIVDICKTPVNPLMEALPPSCCHVAFQINTFL